MNFIRFLAYIFCDLASSSIARNCAIPGMAQFLAIEDEAKAQNIWARKRIKFTAGITEINRQNDQFSVLSDIFVSHHGPTMNLIRDFTDFHMLKLLPVSGVMVLGFAKAYQLEGPMLDVAAHLRES